MRWNSRSVASASAVGAFGAVAGELDATPLEQSLHAGQGQQTDPTQRSENQRELDQAKALVRVLV